MRRCNLAEALEKGSTYIMLKLYHPSSIPYGAAMFSEEHFKKLQPFFAKQAIRVPMLLSVEEIESCLFPKLCVEFFRSKVGRPNVWSVTVSGSVYFDRNGDFLDTLVDFGVFYRDVETEFRTDRVVTWNDKRKRVEIKPSPLCDGDWAIVASKWFDDSDEEEEEPEEPPLILWKSPYSRNIDFPPPEPWIPVDQYARGNPRMVYDGVSMEGITIGK
jgi:hypothetical protein